MDCCEVTRGGCHSLAQGHGLEIAASRGGALAGWHGRCNDWVRLGLLAPFATARQLQLMSREIRMGLRRIEIRLSGAEAPARVDATLSLYVRV